MQNSINMANPIIQQINAELDTLQKELNQFKSTVAYLNGAKENVNNAVLTVNEAKVFYGQKIDELKSTYNSILNLINAVNGAVTKIETINFPERLDNIEKSVNQTIVSINETRTETIDELQIASEAIINADFDSKFNRLQEVVNNSTKANKLLGESIEKQKIPEKIDIFEKTIKSKIDTSIADLQNNTKLISEKTFKSIQDLNLPFRLDKVDANVAGMLSAIQNLQTRLENLERNILERLKNDSERHLSRVEVLQNNINQGLAEIKEQVESTQKKQRNYTFITWLIIAIFSSILFLLTKF